MFDGLLMFPTSAVPMRSTRRGSSWARRLGARNRAGVATAGRFTAGTPVELYRMEWSIGLRRYGQDVTPDWSQFVFAEPDLEEQRKPMTVVLNWPLLLKK